VPPDDPTILEGSTSEENPSGGNSADGSTIIEGASADSSTIIEGAQARAEASFNLVPGGQFQGHTLLKPLQVASGEADLWFIADAQGKEYVLKLYRYGIKPKEEITEKIRSLGYEHVVTIEESGEVSGRHFEILEKIEHGDLDEFAGDKPLEEEQLKVVVEKLGSAVAHLHEAGIIHRDIKPANILVRTLEPLDLVMTDFGISSVSDVSLHMTSVNRTALYSAPEAINGVVARGSDWWCVGIIFLKLLLGKHPLEGMTEQAITFQLVTKGVKVPEEIGQDWQLLLKGLLTRDPDNRWAWSEVEQWLRGKRNIATQYEGDQKEEKKYDYKPFKQRGREIYEPKELAVYLGENWPEGVKHFGRGFITDWVRGDYRDQGLAGDLMNIAEDKELDGDGKLSAVLMVLDESLPMFWKGEVVSRDWLGGNPQAAVEVSQSKLLHYYDLHRKGDELKLGEIGGRIKEVAEDQQLNREIRDAVISLAVNPEQPMKLGEDVINPEWLAAHPKEAVKIMEGPLPAWQERLTGKTSLKEARDGRKDWWEAIKALGVPVDENRVDELILQSEEERRTRFKALWQKFESGEYVGAKDKNLQALLDKGEVGPVEQIVLLACPSSLFMTAEEKKAQIEAEFKVLQEAERIEAERIEAERIEAERIEAERIEAERIEAKRIEANRIEAVRIAGVQKDKQDYLNRILISYHYSPDHLKDEIFIILGYANANALAIPADTLGKIFAQNDELFFLVFNKLNKNPVYLEQLFGKPNAPSFFAQFSGPNRSLRFKTIVDEGQITAANFDHIRSVIKDKEVDQYLLHSRPLNRIFQSLYQEEVGGFSLDDLLEKNNYDLCRRLESGGYISAKTHPIIADLDVYALTQKENNWATVREDGTKFSLLNLYHKYRLAYKIGNEQFPGCIQSTYIRALTNLLTWENI
jgi:hypothetical protein